MSHTYTPSERAKRAKLLAKGAKNAYGDTSAVERELDAIDRTAADRFEREQRAHARQLDAAKDELAHARVRERAAGREDRGSARQARKNAEKRLRDLERAAR